MNTINILLSLLLLAYARHLNYLKDDTIDNQIKVSLPSFFVLIGIGIFIGYSNLSSEESIEPYYLGFVLTSFVICFIMVIVAIKRFLLSLEKIRIEASLLKTPQEVRDFLAFNHIYVKDTPIFLVSVGSQFFWHVGQDLLYADYLISLYGKLADVETEYIFENGSVAYIVFQVGFLGDAKIALENQDFCRLEELKEYYDYTETEC